MGPSIVGRMRDQQALTLIIESRVHRRGCKAFTAEIKPCYEDYNKVVEVMQQQSVDRGLGW